MRDPNRWLQNFSGGAWRWPISPVSTQVNIRCQFIARICRGVAPNDVVLLVRPLWAGASNAEFLGSVLATATSGLPC